jgi:hypothetical protein
MIDLYIPTYGRVGRQATWEALPESWRDRTMLVCVPEEAAALQASTGATVHVAPVRGISATRQWIFRHHPGDKLLMFDDDLKFATRRHDDLTKFRPSSAADVEEMLNLLWGGLDDAHVVGLASRGGANRETAPWRVNQRLFDVMGFRMDTVREEGFRYRQQFMEDFDLQLQFLTHGYPTLMLNSYTKDDFGSNTDGGCSTYRTGVGQMKASLELWENWPNFVGIRKVKSTWDTIGERYDVTVYWSKAFKAGQQWRRLHRLPLIPIPDWADEAGLL